MEYDSIWEFHNWRVHSETGTQPVNNADTEIQGRLGDKVYNYIGGVWLQAHSNAFA